MAGFTAERDMGTEGAGSADTAIRDAIDQGLIPGPRLRISGNAIDILGGHEDAIHFNPAQHVLSNADYANSAEQLVEVIREQHKEGSTSSRSTRPARTSMIDGVCTRPTSTPRPQLAAAVAEAHRLGMTVGVHAMGEPGTLYAAQAGVASIDHATQLSDETMRLMREKAHPRRAHLRHLRLLRHHRDRRTRPRAKPRCSTTKSPNSKSRSPPAVPFRGWLRRRPLPARHASRRNGTDGPLRHEAPRRAPGRHDRTAQKCSAGKARSASSSPATTPTSSPSPAIRSTTYRRRARELRDEKWRRRQ
jgi:hypothetical protein